MNSSLRSSSSFKDPSDSGSVGGSSGNLKSQTNSILKVTPRSCRPPSGDEATSSICAVVDLGEQLRDQSVKDQEQNETTDVLGYGTILRQDVYTRKEPAPGICRSRGTPPAEVFAMGPGRPAPTLVSHGATMPWLRSKEGSIVDDITSVASSAVSPTVTDLGPMTSDQKQAYLLSAFLVDFQVLREDIVDQPCTDTDAAQCIQAMRAEDAKRHLEALYRLVSQLALSVQEPRRPSARYVSVESGATTPQQSTPQTIQLLRFPNRSSLLSLPGPALPNVSSEKEETMRRSRSSSQRQLFCVPLSTPPSPGDKLTPPIFSPCSLSIQGGSSSNLFTLLRGEGMPNLALGVEGSGGSGPGGASSGTLLDPDSATAALHMGNVSVSEFMRNIAAFSAKFENPLYAASIASLSAAECVPVKSTATADVVHEDSENPCDDGAFDINQYSVLEELGSGTQGCVYLAYDNASKEFRALKALKRGLAGSVAMEKFKQEVQIMKRLRHQNIVTLHEVIDDPKLKHIYLVMQYVEKGPLVKWIGTDHKRCEMIDSWRFQYFARQICAGLSYLHQRKIYHRDIKPENILLGSDDQVFLADFGVAQMTREQRRSTILALRSRTHPTVPEIVLSPRIVHSLGDGPIGRSCDDVPYVPQPDGESRSVGNMHNSRRNSSAGLPGLTLASATSQDTDSRGAGLGLDGTPAYFAPELILSEDNNFKNLDQAAVDVWALGVTCYQMLTGRLPFAMDAGELHTAHRLGNNHADDSQCATPNASHATQRPLGASISLNMHGSQQTSLALSSSCLGVVEALTDTHLENYPEHWWTYLRAVVEEPIPYLSDEFLHRAKKEDNNILGENASQNVAEMVEATISSPFTTSDDGEKQRGGAKSANTSSGGLLSIVDELSVSVPRKAATTRSGSPVPLEWFSVLRGMLMKDPAKRWTLEKVRASIKAMGTLHKIESVCETPVASRYGPKYRRGIRQVVSSSRHFHTSQDFQESVELDPDSPWHTNSSGVALGLNTSGPPE